MGIDVRVESESGEVQDEVLDHRNLTQSLMPDREDNGSPCLRFVDPDGDTVFNQLQLPILIAELERRLRGASRPEVKDHGHAVLRLIQAAEGEEHFYVRFSGE